MPFYRSIQARRKRRKIAGAFELQLTSMMDVLVIILVFLLKSYATSTNSFSSVPGMKLPISVSPDVPPDSLQVIITPEGMTFEDNRILDFTQTAAEAGSTDAIYAFKPIDLDEGGRRIIPLYDALTNAREKGELLRAKSTARTVDGKPLPFEGILAIQADKRVQYDTIRKIMYTAAAAGYKVFRFLALQRET
jgi:biopolymer transport protein ExbD